MSNIHSEFPDYDDVAGFVELVGLLNGYDTSWHNNTCPTIGIDDGDLELGVFVDYLDEAQRELRTGRGRVHGRFMVVHPMDGAEVLATNDRDWLVTFINCLREHKIAADLCEEYGFTATATYLRGLLEHT
jgi:hypothetical protein